jgi:cytidylate kinase
MCKKHDSERKKFVFPCLFISYIIETSIQRKEMFMKLIFLGPPGAGKGTLAAKAVEILGLPHISTGAIFRAAIADKTALGLKVKAIIDAGKLVDDDTTIELVILMRTDYLLLGMELINMSQK